MISSSFAVWAADGSGATSACYVHASISTSESIWDLPSISLCHSFFTTIYIYADIEHAYYSAADLFNVNPLDHIFRPFMVKLMLVCKFDFQALPSFNFILINSVINKWPLYTGMLVVIATTNFRVCDMLSLYNFCGLWERSNKFNHVQHFILLHLILLGSLYSLLDLILGFFQEMTYKGRNF